MILVALDAGRLDGAHRAGDHADSALPATLPQASAARGGDNQASSFSGGASSLLPPTRERGTWMPVEARIR